MFKIHNNVIFFIIIFFASLQGLYIHDIGFSPFSLFILPFSIFVLLLKINYSFHIYRAVIIFFIFTILLGLTGSLLSGYFDLKRFIAFLFFIPLILSIFHFDRVDFLRIISVVVFIHISIFYLQFLLLYIFGIELDLIKDFTGRAQKGWGGSYYLPIIGKLVRLGGLYNEPGTYSTFICLLVSLLLFNFDRYRLIIYFSILSVLLSFSTYGLIFSAIFFIYVVVNSNLSVKIFSSILFFTVTSFSLNYFYERFYIHQSSSNGTDFRLDFVFVIYENFLIDFNEKFFFGYGLFNLNINNLLNFDNPINDVGFIFYAFVTSGFIGLLSYFFLFLLIIYRNPVSIVFISILTLSKFSVTWPIFPVLITILFIISDKKRVI